MLEEIKEVLSQNHRPSYMFIFLLIAVMMFLAITGAGRDIGFMVYIFININVVFAVVSDFYTLLMDWETD